MQDLYVTDEGCHLCAQYVLGTRVNSWAEWGEAYGQSSDVILETESLFVIAGLGALTEGYVLLLPKDHYLSIGAVPAEQMREFIRVKTMVGLLIKRLYGHSTFFEHGTSAANPAGASTDHAHMHLVPCDTDFRPRLRRSFEEMQIDSLEALHVLAQSGTPYLFYENATGEMHVYPLSEPIPSQYLRRVWAESVGKPQEWDWREFVGEENVACTIKNVRSALGNQTLP